LHGDFGAILNVLGLRNFEQLFLTALQSKQN
jgi:hypothetical protein